MNEQKNTNDHDQNDNNQVSENLPVITALLINPSINLQNMSPDQRVELGYQLEKGNGSYMQDYEAARVAYASAAADGNPLAMNDLGWLYWNGYGVDQDIEKAKQYFNKAADLGCTIAMVNLGNIAENGTFYGTAYSWYRKAYILGDSVGQFNYANMYHWGWYVKQNYNFAYRIFRELAENGYVDAFFYVGHYLQQGLGVQKDEKKAFQWFQAGEQAGDAYSTTELGRCYSLGLGVEKDEKKGLEYYLEGIDRSDTLAYANVGYCYETGQGTEKNVDLAREYYFKGFQKGNEQCKKEYQRLNKKFPKNPSTDSYDQSFLQRMQEIGGDQGQKTAEYLMKAVRTMGIKTSYSNGTVFTSPIMNIAPRTRPAGDYIRLEHRISKLVVDKRLSEKKVYQMFQSFGDDYGLWDDKQLKIQSNCFYLEMTALYDEKVLHDYVQLLRELALKHLPPKTKVMSFDDLWAMYAEMERQPTENKNEKPSDIEDHNDRAVHLKNINRDPSKEEKVDYHNEIIEAAVQKYSEKADTGTLLGVVLALHQRLLEDADIITPMQFDGDGSDGKKPQLCTIALKDKDGNVLIPLLTSQERQNDNPKWQIFAAMKLKEALKSTFTYDVDHVGLVINPFGNESAVVPYGFVESLLESIGEKV